MEKLNSLYVRRLDLEQAKRLEIGEEIIYIPRYSGVINVLEPMSIHRVERVYFNSCEGREGISIKLKGMEAKFGYGFFGRSYSTSKNCCSVNEELVREYGTHLTEYQIREIKLREEKAKAIFREDYREAERLEYELLKLEIDKIRNIR